ncbi:TetR/AcrR family transcriptional regulator C-terminal domain-containing protein [Amycolatopsis nigrescens]|uniref:TetR/AcrR family transcriptional regulator C-terminal domain-containing protein n=1 Tax=Amycolatopsis nigrescens TaxID=381445 RepID=UPI00037F72EC|nr:TetR/AcrR family transcriptional regulator C-terminal domain-containing protein [Amycolatopsis nigrescens]
MSLNQATVLAAAVELLDEVGLDELSTRRLAARLGVRVGALYWHYANKQALLDAIADQIIGDAAAVPLPGGDQDERLRVIATAQREAMLAHPDGARLIATMSAPGPQGRTFYQRPIAVLREAGLSEATAEVGTDVLTSYVNGFTIEEQARKVDGWSRRDRDRSFHAGLEVVLAGIRALR